MLVVTVEVWPNGDILRRKVIGHMTLANRSNLAEQSDYEGYLWPNYVNGDEIHEHVTVEGHTRSNGAWELVRKVLNKYV